ncbi:MAG: hypothetical protein JXR34_05125 [Bacteroidales bacterium]|nr:hypothetical protein [Bacteroidales bacterium]
MSVIENYKVRFYISDLVGAAIKTNNGLLSSFIWEYCDSDEAIDLLDAINDVLNGSLTIADGVTQGLIFVKILANTTSLYKNADAYFEDETIAPDYTIPTTDLKEIVEAWLDYLSRVYE